MSRMTKDPGLGVKMGRGPERRGRGLERWGRGLAGGILLLALFALGPTVLAGQQDSGADTDADVEVDTDRIVERVRRMAEGGAWTGGPRAALGIEVEADLGNTDDAAGVRVVRVPAGSAAADAGVRSGDVIVSVDGDDLSATPVLSLLNLLSEREPGEVVALTLLRDGEEVVAEVTLQEAPQRERLDRALERVRRELGDREEALQRMDRALRRMDRQIEVRQDRGRRMPDFVVDGIRVDGMLPGGAWTEGCAELRDPGEAFLVGGGRCIGGAEVHALNPGLESYFGASAGILVLEVAEEPVLPVQVGDVIVAVDGREVEDLADLRRILRSYESGEEADLQLLRDGRSMTSAVTVP